MKIFIYATRTFDELDHAKAASEKYGIEFDYTHEYPTMENAHLAQGYDAISFTPCDMGKDMIEQFHKMGVRYLLARSVGFEHIDLKAAKKCGMRVCTTYYNADCVANYAIMLMLMCTRKITHILKRSEVQDYSLKGKLGIEISNCKVGIIGTGNIGKTVIKHLSGFGCEIYANDAYENDEVKKYAKYVPLETLYKECDIISLHAPSNKETYHMINKKALDMMKDEVIIVNTARGTLIDTDALIDAIESGKVAAAGLDVIEDENGLYYYNRMGDAIPNRQMAQLRSYPHVIMSPHTAFYTDDSVREMIEHNFEGLYSFEKSGQYEHELV